MDDFFKGKSKAKKVDTSRANDVASTVPWVEKYRPDSLNKVCSQSETVNVLRESIQSKNLPHLLFYGPPGTGKTSTILALARDMYGPELVKSRILELNASDERGIQVVREKVKNFAKTMVGNNANESHGASLPPYKIIILDEADSMTEDAQAALRRTMETYSKVTRFCLICNYVSRIIEPLASRCAKFRFKPLPKTEMRAKLTQIVDGEKVACTEEAIEALIKTSEGDMRKAITSLQSAYHLSTTGKITDATVRDMTGVIPSTVIDKLMDAIQKDSFGDIQSVVDDLIYDGYSAAQILQQIHSHVIQNPEFSSLQKSKMALVFGTTDFALSEGADEQLQILSMNIPTGANYHFFKEGVKPMWEDSANANGGRWLVEYPRRVEKDINEKWINTMLALIGESYQDSQNICGIVFSNRKTCYRFSMWTRSPDTSQGIKEIGETFLKYLNRDKSNEIESIPFNRHVASRGAKPLFEAKKQ
ncbi:Subunit of heteropentameric Replication factor C (RF-C) [Mycoemilia scoparia]|uniref:Subunit of heteropentameric Replication factor C (RF-C) n=1 Tax=Mycoemilia scoparia TaxID=417184 RepID=A0A9W7ZZ96_9FUNG|nr:Subunit of heteropentameric Replication factor C (RF-C) [Mycoemilia scoparia]